VIEKQQQPSLIPLKWGQLHGGKKLPSSQSLYKSNQERPWKKCLNSNRENPWKQYNLKAISIFLLDSINLSFNTDKWVWNTDSSGVTFGKPYSYVLSISPNKKNLADSKLPSRSSLPLDNTTIWLIIRALFSFLYLAKHLQINQITIWLPPN